MHDLMALRLGRCPKTGNRGSESVAGSWILVNRDDDGHAELFPLECYSGVLSSGG